jgi:hypothetical protein
MLLRDTFPAFICTAIDFLHRDKRGYGSTRHISRLALSIKSGLMIMYKGAFVCCVVFFFALLGCSDNKPLTLDKDDIRFAGLYSDYLLQSGVTDRENAIAASSFDSAQLDTLLVRHALDRPRFTVKVQLYRRNPELWRLVLVQVRENIRKRTAAAQ